MKIRTGFVSNSSSSSFTIRRDALTLKQYDQIMNHREHPSCGEDDFWSIYEEGEYIKCSTWMDNFDLRSYVKEIGVPLDEIETDWNF